MLSAATRTVSTVSGARRRVVRLGDRRL